MKIKEIRSVTVKLFIPLFLPSGRMRFIVCHLGQIAQLFVCYCQSTDLVLQRDFSECDAIDWVCYTNSLNRCCAAKNTLPDSFLSWKTGVCKGSQTALVVWWEKGFSWQHQTQRFFLFILLPEDNLQQEKKEYLGISENTIWCTKHKLKAFLPTAICVPVLPVKLELAVCLRPLYLVSLFKE